MGKALVKVTGHLQGCLTRKLFRVFQFFKNGSSYLRVMRKQGTIKLTKKYVVLRRIFRVQVTSE